MKRLVVTADDFGLSIEVNEAVETAHRHGILNAASLMVAAPAVADAVARARRWPSLRVGLHLVLVEERPTLPPAEIPHLVDACGRFRADMARAAFDLFASPATRDELNREIEAQFAAFAATGLPLDHVNAHKHYHLHPTIGAALLRIGCDNGMKALRAPSEPVAILRAVERGTRAGGVIESIFARRLAARARARGVTVPDQVFGLAWSGAMTRTRIAGLLSRLPNGLTEIYAHPATGGGFSGAAQGYRYAEELAALVAPDVKAARAASGARFGGFADI